MTKQANVLLLILLSFLLAHWLRFGPIPLPPGYLQALLLVLLISSIVLPATGAFRQEFEWAFIRKLRRLLAGWAVVLMILIAFAAILKITDDYSRIWFGLWVIISNGGLVLVLLISHTTAVRARRRSAATVPIAMVGAGPAAARLERRFSTESGSNMKLVGRFGEAWSSHPVLPTDELAQFVQENRIQAVWIAIPWENKPLLDSALEALSECVVDVNVVPDLHQYRLLNQGVSEWAGLPVISLAGTPLTGTEMRLKNWFDRIAALILLVLLSPVMLLFSALIRFSSPGSVMFRQLRHGIGGETIEIIKFRTMAPEKRPTNNVRQAVPDDPRVTRIGRFLRRSSLDELPQLFNVLKGEMSLVGPRPHAVEHNDIYKSRIAKYMLRHKVKPGITGWAQINGFRGLTDTQEKMALRIEHDLWYIQNWSLWLDLKILFQTPFIMIHPNAY